MINLPTKGKNLDWSLGPGVTALRDHYNGDYALFVYVRDSYSSPGRTAVIILGAIAGIGVQGGTQVGFASLVDLRTGKIVWFNRLISSTGSLKEDKPAAATVKNLLAGLPLVIMRRIWPRLRASACSPPPKRGRRIPMPCRHRATRPT